MPSDVIVHLFDWRFDDILPLLDTLARQGYAAIQISPPQKSIDNPQWWGRYQPIDHTRIEGPLGSEDDLRRLINAAHAMNPPMRIIVDVVLNHMAEHSPSGAELHYPRFLPEYFHPRSAIDWNSLDSIRTGWIGYGPDLPDLRTELAYVRAEARRYLEMLLALGADGFRLDAVKHIEPEYFDEVLAGLPAATLIYGEYIAQPGHLPVMTEYLRTMRLMDFTLLEALGQVLNHPGSADQLRDLGGHFQLLPAHRTIGFVTNHDLELNQYGGFRLQPDALAMAHAVTLVLHAGMPLVWHQHRDDPLVLAAMQLRSLGRKFGRTCVLAEPDCVAWRIGDTGLLILNTGQAARQISLTELGMGHLTLRDCVGQQVYQGALTVLPRSPLLAMAE